MHNNKPAGVIDVFIKFEPKIDKDDTKKDSKQIVPKLESQPSKNNSMSPSFVTPSNREAKKEEEPLDSARSFVRTV